MCRAPRARTCAKSSSGTGLRNRLKTNVEWQAWGSRDPLFGVASWRGRERSGGRPWTDEEFYALGDDWLDFREHWKRYAALAGTVVEIGCGAGRITKRLASDFDQVVACDVAEGMIEYARQRVAAGNIRWAVSDGSHIPATDASADAVFSCQVLQHLPSNAAQLACFAEMYRVLRPGATLMVHIPVHAFPGANRRFAIVARLLYRMFLLLTSLKGALWRWAMRFGARPYMHGVSYAMDELFWDLSALGFERVEFAAFPVRSNGALHTCVLATRPG